MKSRKRIRYLEIAKHYGVHRHTVRRLVGGYNLREVVGLIGAIKRMEEYKRVGIRKEARHGI